MDFDVVPYEDIVWGERLGGGSFGSVYKGQYLGLDIAIKEIHASTEYNVHKYFEREWRIMRECRHPNIVLFLGLCKEPTGDGRVFIVSEHVPGGNLRSLIRSTVPFPWRLRLTFATDIARAVAYLHARQCIHRDLKGENLLITSNNRIKVADFGFARITSRSDEELRNMTYCGTDGYMSPEIVMGENFDLPTDVYSLGIIFIEILTRIVVGAKVYSRQAPVFTPDPDEVRRRASPGCPGGLIDLALQCCSFAPEERPTLPDILVRLRAIEMSLPDEQTGEIPSSSVDVRRAGKRALPLFDSPSGSSSDSEALMAQVDDQLADDDESEKQVYHALVGVDIVIDGDGPSMAFTTMSGSDIVGDTSDNAVYSPASEMRPYELLASTKRCNRSGTHSSSKLITAHMPCTYPEEECETSSTRTVKGLPDGLSQGRDLHASPRGPQLAIAETVAVPSIRLRRSQTVPSSRGTLSHRFLSMADAGAAHVLSAKRIPSSFAAHIARALLPRTLARSKEKCMVCSKRLDPRSGFQCDHCGIFVHTRCVSASMVGC